MLVHSGERRVDICFCFSRRHTGTAVPNILTCGKLGLDQGILYLRKWHHCSGDESIVDFHRRKNQLRTKPSLYSLAAIESTTHSSAAMIKMLVWMFMIIWKYIACYFGSALELLLATGSSGIFLHLVHTMVTQTRREKSESGPF